MKKFCDMLNKRKSGSSIIEFTFVFIILMVFIIGVLDIGLFFRQIYQVQTVADETMVTLQTRLQCGDEAAVTATFSDVVRKYYGQSPTFGDPDSDDMMSNYVSTDGNYTYILSCRTPSIPASLEFGYNYKGLMFFVRGKYIYSSFSANTSYF